MDVLDSYMYIKENAGKCAVTAGGNEVFTRTTAGALTDSYNFVYASTRPRKHYKLVAYAIMGHALRQGPHG